MEKIHDINKDDILDLYNMVSNFKENELETDFEELAGDNVSGSQDNNGQDTCKNCNSTSIYYDEGSYFCKDCGELQDIKVNHDQEWRYYGSDDSKNSDPNRVGLPTSDLLPESSLGTVISYKFGCANSYDFNRMRQYQQWNSMPYKERSLWKEYDKMQMKAQKAGIPSIIIDRAKVMYKTLSETRISRGSNRIGLLATCIYIACKLENVSRSAKEIADIYEIPVNEMTRGIKNFMEIIHYAKKLDEYSIRATGPLDYINRFCSNLNVSRNIFHICEYVTVKAYQLDIVDENTPPSIAAGSIFLVINICKLDISKKMVAKACKISEVTISKCYKKMCNYVDDLIPKKLLSDV